MTILLSEIVIKEVDPTGGVGVMRPGLPFLDKGKPLREEKTNSKSILVLPRLTADGQFVKKGMGPCPFLSQQWLALVEEVLRRGRRFQAEWPKLPCVAQTPFHLNN